jgi:hypothetical protein
METRHKLPGTRLDAASHAVGSAGGENLVIENLAEFAAAGAALLTSVCVADCAFSIPGPHAA